ncbi:MAG: hypothetical protein J6U65_05675, partial [Bacteroidaceae bacterium]|nr:hypothetical protein [Bacteroidaceae bacterium]
SRAFGKQIIRSKATSVANPKTIGQNTQRAILASVAKAAAALNAIVDHSFVSVTYGAESVRHFRKINMAKLRSLYLSGQTNVINLTPKGGGFLPNPFIISEGSLPSFGVAQSNAENVGFFMNGNQVLIPEANGCTVSSFLDVYPYIQGGDQLTLVRINRISGTIADGDALFSASYDRIVFATDAFDNGGDYITTDEGFFNPDKLDLTKTTNTQMLSVVEAGPGKLMGVAHSGNGENPYAVALILSRKVNNSWQRSTQELYLCEWDDFMNNESAIASYGATESLLSDTEYLNQANENEGREGVSGPYMQWQSYGVDQNMSGSVLIGASSDIGPFTIETGAPFELYFNAYGTSENPLIALDLTGTNADGEYEQRALISNNTGNLVFNVGEDGNLVGTYHITAVFRNGRAVANFTLSSGE